MEYVQEFGTIIPAKMSGFVYKGIMMGSETSRRCRELREAGKLESAGAGKFTVYSFIGGEVQKKVDNFLKEFPSKEKVKEIGVLF